MAGQSDNEAMWYAFDEGKSIGLVGSEGGIITCDEEHSEGSRITIERDGRAAPFSITCGIYGWMVHTRFFSNEGEAQNAFNQMKESLEAILKIIPFDNDSDFDAKMKAVSSELGNFVEQYP